jgi:hypothetical protein
MIVGTITAVEHRGWVRVVMRANTGTVYAMDLDADVAWEFLWELGLALSHAVAPSPRCVCRSLAVWIIQACENAVDLLFGFGYRIFFFFGEVAQRGARQNGKIGTSRVDADAPSRPLPHRHEVVAAISPGFRSRHLGPHAMAPRSVSITEANSGGRNVATARQRRH